MSTLFSSTSGSDTLCSLDAGVSASTQWAVKVSQSSGRTTGRAPWWTWTQPTFDRRATLRRSASTRRSSTPRFSVLDFGVCSSSLFVFCSLCFHLFFQAHRLHTVMENLEKLWSLKMVIFQSWTNYWFLISNNCWEKSYKCVMFTWSFTLSLT